MKSVEEFMVSAGAKVLGLVALLVVYGIVNLVLVGGQTLWHSGGRAKLEEQQIAVAIKRQALDQKSAALNKLDFDLKWRALAIKRSDAKLDEQQALFSKLKARFTAVEKRHPRGVPPAIFGGYKRDVEKHNRIIEEYNAGLESRRAAHAKYSKLLDDYNAQVDAYNSDLATVNQDVAAVKKQAESLGVTYLVPVPGIGGRRRR